MLDISIDLETLSTHNDAAILSIGACYFDMATGEIGKTFHRHIALEDNAHRGHISVDTVKWWLKQDESARMAIVNGNGVGLPYALTDLRDFVPFNKQAKFWSNGATFDLVIIRNAFDRYRQIVPWQYWQERDCRTIVDIAKRLTGTDVSKTPFDGTKHDALADAMHQAKFMAKAFNLISQHVRS